MPASAASLVVGGFALLLGSLLTPSTGGDSAATLEVVREKGGLWFAVALLFMLAAITLLMGLPSTLLLFPRGGPGRGVGLTAVAVFSVACAGTAGYAMILAFLRALVRADAVRVGRFDEVAADPGVLGFIYGWVATFYLGELLLAVAVLRAGTTPRWVPVLLLLHLLTLPAGAFMSDSMKSAATGLVALAFAGLAISANNLGAAAAGGQRAPAAWESRSSGLSPRR